MLADLGALAALHADHGLCCAVAFDDLKTCLGRIKFLVESLGACTHTLETCHALGTLFDGQFFHIRSPFLFFKPANKGSHEFLAIENPKTAFWHQL